VTQLAQPLGGRLVESGDPGGGVKYLPHHPLVDEVEQVLFRLRVVIQGTLAQPDRLA
jgi:hypothetical protein